jgi:catechol 2,3-dioxygenase-like lactoylglutathione lyase family enzyme
MRFKLLLAGVTLLFGTVAMAQSTPARPKITGVSHLAVYTSNPAATEYYYTVTLGAAKEPDPENPKGVRYALSSTQFIEVLPLPADAGVNRMDHAAFNTEDAEGLRKYLKLNGWLVPDQVTKGSDGSAWFEMKDPELNRIQFVQPPANAKVTAPKAVGHHIIHIGFLVHSQEKEDTFYRQGLGFRPYWYGGMVAARTDWVSQQVPNGHDWLEYMLTNVPAGMTAGISQHQLGVLDHISIGENSVEDTYMMLNQAGRLKGVECDKGPKVGRDGKVQFNMYDPDQIRTELMSFHAVENPCCSPFTAEDPTK